MENRSHFLDADASGQDAQAGEEKCHADEDDRHRQAGEKRRREAGQHQRRQEEAHLPASVMIARRAEAMLASIKRRKPAGTQARSTHCRVQAVSAQRSACWKERQADSAPSITTTAQRSEERRVGKECRSRWSP